MGVLLSVVLLISAMAPAVFAETDDNTAQPCTLTEGCTLEAGHTGECVVENAGETVPTCAQLPGCTEDGHAPECPLYVPVESSVEQTENGEETGALVCAQLPGCTEDGHAPECPLYVAVESGTEPTESGDESSVLVCAQLPGCAEGSHAPECPLYVANESDIPKKTAQTADAKTALVLDIAEGSVIIGNGTVTQANGEPIEIPEEGLTLTGQSAENTVTINPGSGNTALLTVNGLELQTSTGASLIDVQSGTAVITLSGTNSLAGGGSGYSDSAPLHVGAGQALQLVGDGTLTVTNGSSEMEAFGVAIGGSAGENGGSITISSGTVNVLQFGPAAGIGGGGPADSAGGTGNSGNIQIEGGNVNVTVQAVGKHGGGSGIGPGVNYNTTASMGKDGVLDSVTISGGVVAVKSISSGGMESGPAIGTGRAGDAGLIHITGSAQVTAIADVSAAIGGAANSANSSSVSGDGSIQIDGNAVVNTPRIWAMKTKRELPTRCLKQMETVMRW